MLECVVCSVSGKYNIGTELKIGIGIRHLHNNMMSALSFLCQREAWVWGLYIANRGHFWHKNGGKKTPICNDLHNRN